MSPPPSPASIGTRSKSDRFREPTPVGHDSIGNQVSGAVTPFTLPVKRAQTWIGAVSVSWLVTRIAPFVSLAMSMTG